MNLRINNDIHHCPLCQSDGMYLVDIYGGRHPVDNFEMGLCISHLKCPTCKKCFKIHWVSGSIPTPILNKDIENYLRANV